MTFGLEQFAFTFEFGETELSALWLRSLRTYRVSVLKSCFDLSTARRRH